MKGIVVLIVYLITRQIHLKEIIEFTSIQRINDAYIFLTTFDDKNDSSINYHRKEINEIKKNQNDSLVITKNSRTNKYEHISLTKLIKIYNQYFCIIEEIDCQEKKDSALYFFDPIDYLFFVYKPCLNLEQFYFLKSDFKNNAKINEQITKRNQLIESILGKFKQSKPFILKNKNQKQTSKSFDIPTKHKNDESKERRSKLAKTKIMITPSSKNKFYQRNNDSFITSNKYEKLLEINDFISENQTINKKINEFYQEEDDLKYVNQLNSFSEQNKIKEKLSPIFNKISPPVSRLKRKFLKLQKNNIRVSSFQNENGKNILLNRLTASAIANHNWTNQVCKNRIVNLSPEFEQKHDNSLIEGKDNFSYRKKGIELKNKIYINSSKNDDRFYSLVKDYEEENEIFFGMKNKDYKEVLDFYDMNNNLQASNSKLNMSLKTVTYIKDERKRKENCKTKSLHIKEMKCEEAENDEVFQVKPKEYKNVGIKLREKRLKKSKLHN